MAVRCLIVDDNRGFLQVARTLLERQGLTIAGLASTSTQVRCRSRRSKVIQQGQVLKLKAKVADGQPLWAYRYRLEGRGSARPHVGGFATRARRCRRLRRFSSGSGPAGERRR